VQEINTSLDGRLDKLEQTSGSLNTFSSSALIRLSNLETTSGSHIIRLNNLESKSASVDISLGELNSYTSSLKTAIGLSGTDVTVLGNLTVNGTTTQINSTQVNIGENILELNFGGSATEAGIYTKDATGASTTSGSLLWDSNLDYWKAGKKDLESKILLAGGDGVLSGSTDFNAFSTSVDSRLSNLQSKSASVDISIANINSTTASLNISISNLNTATASLYTSASLMTASIASLTASVSALQAFSGNINVRFDNLQTYTTSVENRFITLGNYTGSVNDRFTTLGQVTSSLHIFSGSTLDRLTNLESKSASVDTSITNINSFTQSVNDRFTTLAIYTGSINSDLASIHQTTSSLNSFSASISTSVSTSLASIIDHEARIEYVEGLNGISGGNPLIPLNTFSGSAKISIANLESFTSSIDATIKTKLNVEGVISGAAQILITELDGFADYNDGIMADIGAKEEIASATHTLVSGSLQVISLLPSGVISGSSQISSLFEPIASSTRTLVSGSTQVLGGSGVWSSSVQMPAGVVSGSSQILGGSTIHSGSSGDYQFNSIGVGAAASTTAGEIRAIGDITAYYSSDIRLKENIVPIPNALSKIESISGNTYDWKAGYEEIHSHKGNDVGVIAQEIEEILPQIVTNRDNGYKAVQYEKIIPLLIEAIKELSAKIKGLENK
jgi:uncharacterized coiled-coil protein SlyX